MNLLLACLLLPLAGGCVSALSSRYPALARWSSALGVALGGVCGLALSLNIWVTGIPLSDTLPWNLPLGAFRVGVDSLSAFFLMVISLVLVATAFYSAAYLRHDDHHRSQGLVGLFFSLLASGMILVVSARDAVLFLMAWEIMSVSAFFLVMYEDDQVPARQAGWTYLVATHIGSAFLMAMFILMAREAGTTSFQVFNGLAWSPESRSLIFVLALFGFGAKAGLVPLHVWLPEAHPVAPSHVSAVMSGVMIKTGIYGLLRVWQWLGTPIWWWGALLMGIGLVTGILGILSALAQNDLKRLLAYCSVENIGIICLGIGLAQYAAAEKLPGVAILALAGAILHLLNHALSKSLLFLGAGIIRHATGTLDLNRMGGLARRLNGVGGPVLVGSLSIAGLPPLNGFMGEFLLYVAAFQGLLSLQGFAILPMVLTIVGLALIGGLASACFAKVFGIAFLGEPRSAEAASAHVPGRTMSRSVLALALLSGLVALSAPLALPALTPVLGELLKFDHGLTLDTLRFGGGLLGGLLAGGTFLACLVGLLAALRRHLLRGRLVGLTGTWDCGYAVPTSRMSYSAGAFTQPLVDVFGFFLRPFRHWPAISGLFPLPATHVVRIEDVSRERLLRPLFQIVGSGMGHLRWLQEGRLQVYVLYIAITLIALMGWNLW